MSKFSGSFTTFSSLSVSRVAHDCLVAFRIRLIRAPEIRGGQILVDPLAGTLTSVPLVFDAIDVREVVAAVVALDVLAAVVLDDVLMMHLMAMAY